MEPIKYEWRVVIKWMDAVTDFIHVSTSPWYSDRITAQDVADKLVREVLERDGRVFSYTFTSRVKP